MPLPDLTSPQLLETEAPEYPIPRDLTAIIHRERWWVNEANYVRTPQSTAHPDNSALKLTDEQPYRRTADHLFFLREYATIPATRSDPLDIPVTFPGFIIDFIARFPFTVNVTARELFEYYLNADPTHPSTGIATIARHRFLLLADGLTWIENDYVSDGPGAVSGFAFLSSSPTLATYVGWIDAGTEFVAEESRLEQYRGNIWARRTPYVKAQ